MKAFFDQLIHPGTTHTIDNVHYWRERIIGITMLGVAVLMTGIYGFSLYTAINAQAWAWVIISTFGYALLILVTFSPKAPYRIKSFTLLVLFYGIGLFTAIRWGDPGAAGIWLVFLGILAAILIGRWSGFSAVILGSLTLLLLGFGLNRGWINIFPQTPEIQNVSTWIMISALLLAVGFVTVFVFNTLLEELERNAQSKHQIAGELKEDRETFENRRREVERRENQVHTAAEISRTISAELDPDQLFPRVVNLVRDRFNLYYVGVFIVDPRANYAVLKAGTGEAGKAMLEAGHRLMIDGQSMIGWAVSRRTARIALDVGLEAVHFDNPYLPDTRSELALPMVTSTQVLGALTVQSNQAEAFDNEDIVVLQGVADSLAIAVQNARLFQQAETSLNEIRSLHQQYLGEAWSGVSSQGDLRYAFKNPLPSSETNGEPITLQKPITIRDSVIGSLVLETDKPSWNPDEEAFIDAVVSQAAIALENVRLMEVTQRSAQSDRLISDLSSKAWASTNIETILQTTLRELVQGLQASNGIILLDSPEFHQDPD